MKETPKARPDPGTPSDPGLDVFPAENVRGEVPACPTGLAAPSVEPDEITIDAQEVHGPLEVEHLEGRQGAAQEEEEKD